MIASGEPCNILPLMFHKVPSKTLLVTSSMEDDAFVMELSLHTLAAKLGSDLRLSARNLGFALPSPVTNAAPVLGDSASPSHAVTQDSEVLGEESTITTGDPPAIGRIQEEANSLEHALTHEPKNPHCQRRFIANTGEGMISVQRQIRSVTW